MSQNENGKIHGVKRKKSPRKTLTLTFRIDEEVAKQLRSECQETRISVNNMVNHILTQFIQWGRFEAKIGMVPVSKQILKLLFAKLDELEVTNIANSTGKSAIEDITLFMNNEITLQSFLNWFELRMRKMSAEVKRVVDPSQTESYTISHDLGKNWSLYNKILLESVCTDLFHIAMNVKISDSIIKFKVTVPKPA